MFIWCQWIESDLQRMIANNPTYLNQMQKYFSYVSFEISKAVYFKITEFQISEDRGDICSRNLIWHNKTCCNGSALEHNIPYNLEYFIRGLGPSDFWPEDGNSLFFRKFGIQMQEYTMSHTGRSQTWSLATFRMAWNCIRTNTGTGLSHCKTSLATYVELVNLG